MDIGLHYVSFSHPSDPAQIGPTLARTAEIAEASGIATFSLMDHFLQLEAAGMHADEPMLEGYTGLGFVAALSRRMTLGLLVTGVMYRNPGVLVKTVTTLDVVSGGRARFAIGASWYEREQAALGIPVVPIAERFERLEETLQIAHQMWSDDDGPYEGRHHQLAETLCEPQPLQRPRPPILVGGGGERKTLRLVARYADACNLFGESVEVVAHKLDVLRDHCESEGRDYDELGKTVLALRSPLADTDAFLAQLEQFADLGITEVQVMPDRHPVEFVERLADLLPLATAI